jgi:hypothetical protein
MVLSIFDWRFEAARAIEQFSLKRKDCFNHDDVGGTLGEFFCAQRAPFPPSMRQWNRLITAEKRENTLFRRYLSASLKQRHEIRTNVRELEADHLQGAFI